MKIISIIGMLATIICFYSQAQNSTSNAQLTMNSLNEGSNLFVAFDASSKEIEGVVTLFPEYVPGRLFLSTGELVAHPEINYNAYSDEAAVILNGKERRVASSKVKSFQLFMNGDTITFNKVKFTDKKSVFAQQINTGKVSLLKYSQKKIEENDPKDPYSSALVSRKLALEEKFYLQSGNKLVEIKHRKGFLAAYPDESEVLATFIKQQNTDFKSASDLKQLVDYLNSLAPAGDQ